MPFPRPDTTPPVTNTNFVDMPLTLPFHANSFSRKPNCTPRADKQKTNFMRGTVHHEYRQMPLRMKFCASFPVAPQGRGNGTFLIFLCICIEKRPRPKPAPHKQPMPVFLPHGSLRSKSSAINVPAVLQHIHFLLSHNCEHIITRRFSFVNQHSPFRRWISRVYSHRYTQFPQFYPQAIYITLAKIRYDPKNVMYL